MGVMSFEDFLAERSARLDKEIYDEGIKPKPNTEFAIVLDMPKGKALDLLGLRDQYDDELSDEAVAQKVAQDSYGNYTADEILNMTEYPILISIAGTKRIPGNLKRVDVEVVPGLWSAGTNPPKPDINKFLVETNQRGTLGDVMTDVLDTIISKTKADVIACGDAEDSPYNMIRDFGDLIKLPEGWKVLLKGKNALYKSEGTPIIGAKEDEIEKLGAASE